MGLKPEGIQKVAEKIAGRKAKTALEMGEKDYPFSKAQCRRDLPGRRDAVRHPRRDAARLPRPLDVGLLDDGALPCAPPLELEPAGSSGGFGFLRGRSLSLGLCFSGHGGGGVCC